MGWRSGAAAATAVLAIGVAACDGNDDADGGASTGASTPTVGSGTPTTGTGFGQPTTPQDIVSLYRQNNPLPPLNVFNQTCVDAHNYAEAFDRLKIASIIGGMLELATKHKVDAEAVELAGMAGVFAAQSCNPFRDSFEQQLDALYD